jgi:hypothetical protein
MNKNSLRLILFGLLLLITGISKGQSNNVRGFYVSDATSWLGNTTAENNILSYAQNNGFTYITLYGLGSLSWSSTTAKNQLASFVSRAHLQYGIDEVGAAGELYSFFNNYVIPYNNGRAYQSERIDVCNFEFEFWNMNNVSNMYCSKYLSPNGYNCDTAGAFKFAIREFQRIKTLAASKGMITEIYLGWPNRGQVNQISAVADRILLHAYRQDDSDVYQYSRNRLIDIASTSRTVTVIPIFSSEPSFMQSWLTTHSQSRAYQTYSDDYTNETGSWKSKINLQGYTWFTYTYLPQTSPAVATITASGSTSLNPGQDVTLTANSGSAYRWSPNGETTRSITVTTAGSYSVRVTNSSGQSATSSPVSVTVSAAIPVPTITVTGSLSICPGDYVVLSSSSADSYLWSNGETTRSIVVTTAGTYTVRAYDANGAYETSTAKTVTLLAAPSRPSITASGSLQLNVSNPSVNLTSSSASTYRWSSGSGNRTISVTNGGVYKVTVTNSNGCKATSSAVTVISSGCTPPAVPVISTSSHTTINIGETITLTSTYGDGYLWSNGSHSRSITVSTTGTYTVRVYNKGGCFSTSLPVQVIVVAARLTQPVAGTIENISEISAYPNPARDQVNLKFDAQNSVDYTLDILDLTGRQLHAEPVQSVSGANLVTVDLTSLPRGIYFARMSAGNERKTVKLILE